MPNSSPTLRGFMVTMNMPVLLMFLPYPYATFSVSSVTRRTSIRFLPSRGDLVFDEDARISFLSALKPEDDALPLYACPALKAHSRRHRVRRFFSCHPP